MLDPPFVDGPYYDNFNDEYSTFYIDFDDGFQVVFCPHPWPVEPPRLSYTLYRWGVTGQELDRFNIHTDEGGGRTTQVRPIGPNREDDYDLDRHRHAFGVHWERAYNHLRPRPYNSPERKRAWSYVEGSLIFAQRLQEPRRRGLFGA
jgi:hypothetical protein